MHRFSMFLLAAIITVAATADLAVAAKFRCGVRRGASPYDPADTPDYDHDRYAPNQKEVMKRFGAFVSSFDGDDDDDGDGRGDLLGVPSWVSYELKGVQPNAKGEYREPDISIDRPNRWYRSPGLSFLWTDRQGVSKKGIDSSYSGIGRVWNRGHLAMSDHAQRIGPEAACNTHVFWNAVPQAADMNQGPWRHLENYSAAASNKFGRLWIIAGPVFEKDKPIGNIGESSKGEVPVAVPHAIFKVLVRELNGGEVDALAFLFAQPYEEGTDGQPRPTATWRNCNKAGKGFVYNHRPRLRSVEEIEGMTGLTFFPGTRNRVRVRAEVPTSLWGVEKNYWDTNSLCAKQNYVP